MHITKYIIPIATNGSGAFSDSIHVDDGLFHQLRYVPDGASPLDTGADLSITDSAGLTLYSHSNIGTSAFDRLPRRLVANSASGAESTTVLDYIATLGNLTVTIAQGGASKAGTLYLWVTS